MGRRRVSVAVPVALDRALTYAVPDDWAVPPAPGRRVLVPLGHRALVGVVREHSDPSPPETLRELLADLDDDAPTLTPDVLALCEWLADYYVAPIGEAYRLALPGLLGNADARTATATRSATCCWVNPACRRSLRISSYWYGIAIVSKNYHIRK